MATIEPMTLADLELVLDWAADEGWNPGLEDAAAMLRADPGGFLVKRVEGHPAAAISVVNHGPDFAFLGLYIAHPDFRGQGHGIDVWRAGLAHAGSRTVGLDGVPAQQANYEVSGFVRAGRTVRFAGRMADAAQVGPVRALAEADLPALLARDREVEGHDRAGFIAGWLRGCATRETLVIEGDRPAYATARDCRVGRKIGPLVADDAGQARALIAGLSRGQEVFVDVPEACPDLAALLSEVGFVPAFETARMYLGPAPDARPSRFGAVATLELG